MSQEEDIDGLIELRDPKDFYYHRRQEQGLEFSEKTAAYITSQMSDIQPYLERLAGFEGALPSSEAVQEFRQTTIDGYKLAYIRRITQEVLAMLDSNNRNSTTLLLDRKPDPILVRWKSKFAKFPTILDDALTIGQRSAIDKILEFLSPPGDPISVVFRPSLEENLAKSGVRIPSGSTLELPIQTAIWGLQGRFFYPSFQTIAERFGHLPEFQRGLFDTGIPDISLLSLTYEQSFTNSRFF